MTRAPAPEHRPGAWPPATMDPRRCRSRWRRRAHPSASRRPWRQAGDRLRAAVCRSPCADGVLGPAITGGVPRRALRRRAADPRRRCGLRDRAAADDASAASSSWKSRCSSTPGSMPSSVRDHLLCLRVHLKRLGAPPGVLKSPHQQQPEPLAHRVLRHKPTQLRNHLRRPAAGEVRLDAQFGRGEPELRHAVGLRGEQWRQRDVGEQRPAPQPERVTEQRGGAVFGSPAAERTPALRDQRLEVLDVQVARRRPQHVPGRPVEEQPALGVADDLLQPVHVNADQVVRRTRRVIAPQLDRSGVSVGTSCPCRSSKAASSDRHLAALIAVHPSRGQHLKRPQDAEAHQGRPSERTLSSASGKPQARRRGYRPPDVLRHG